MKTNIRPIYFRELKSLFYSPIAYIVAFVMLVVAGYFFSIISTSYANNSMMVMQRGGKTPMLFLDYLIMPFLANLTVTLMFVMPFLSMRFFSEEKKNGTIETLFTFPFTDFDILMGKFLAGMTLLGGLVLVVAFYPLLISGQADIHWPPVLLGYLALLLVGAQFLSIGTFASSLTENQVISAALTFGLCLLLFVVNWVTQGKSGFFYEVLGQLGMMGHFQGLAKGVIHLKDITYFILFIAFMLFATLRVLESKKWR